MALQAAVRRLHETRTGQREQDVIPSERRPTASTFEQDRVLLGKGRVQAGKRVPWQGRPRRHCGARKTRLPLVPPNPKEFDSAIRTGARRALPGT